METYGHLDILVNNAGITRDDLLMKMSEEAFDAVIATTSRELLTRSVIFHAIC